MGSDKSTKVIKSFLITGADLSFKTSWQEKWRKKCADKVTLINILHEVSPLFSRGEKKKKQFIGTRWMTSNSRRESKADIKEEVDLYFLQREEECGDL